MLMPETWKTHPMPWGQVKKAAEITKKKLRKMSQLIIHTNRFLMLIFIISTTEHDQWHRNLLDPHPTACYCSPVTWYALPPSVYLNSISFWADPLLTIVSSQEFLFNYSGLSSRTPLCISLNNSYCYPLGLKCGLRLSLRNRIKRPGLFSSLAEALLHDRKPRLLIH